MQKLIWFSLLAALMFVGRANAFQGELLAEFPYQVSRLFADPNRPIVYASSPDINGVVVVDTETLEILATPFVGANPGGMAISNDGQLLYVANRNSNFVGVLETSTFTLVDSIAIPELAHDVEVGWDGRLYVLGDDSLMQLDPITGNSVGPAIRSNVYGGELEINAAKDRLYYCDHGLSPASLYQYEISGSTATLLWESPHGGTSGSNGQDLALSNNGEFISYACGAGQGGYVIAKYRTADMLIEGTFDCGAYPREVTFSPDNKLAFTVNSGGSIKVWNTQTFLQDFAISTTGEAHKLICDKSGLFLFAAMSTGVLQVFSSPQAACRS